VLRNNESEAVMHDLAKDWMGSTTSALAARVEGFEAGFEVNVGAKANPRWARYQRIAISGLFQRPMPFTEDSRHPGRLAPRLLQ
jgi:hypothetical protein